jgi:hypothetical protein
MKSFTPSALLFALIASPGLATEAIDLTGTLSAYECKVYAAFPGAVPPAISDWYDSFTVAPTQRTATRNVGVTNGPHYTVQFDRVSINAVKKLTLAIKNLDTGALYTTEVDEGANSLSVRFLQDKYFSYQIGSTCQKVP